MHSYIFFFFLMIRRPPRSTLSSSSAASDVYKRQSNDRALGLRVFDFDYVLGPRSDTMLTKMNACTSMAGDNYELSHNDSQVHDNHSTRTTVQCHVVLSIVPTSL
eukprot:TRINITY_DN1106_c0_g1_i14.p1 TRINITY_DN1106_c0_g1~~TRINITY_DN1106_c0_g1_i14.p1  ORF type:complete len:105 (-),score=17.93 TRINITY_DN1106_c0_g1_i14:196-510(-)